MTAQDQNPCHFWRLPYELRCEIYMLATPPRLVHVREGWEYEDEREKQEAKADPDGELLFAYQKFAQKLRDSPSSVDLRVHPEIAHFAHNWNQLRPLSRRQPILAQKTLVEYGFSSTECAHQPWKPTKETPSIPPSMLADRPGLAFELVRRSYLWSQAPIPPLLHTCSDSRRMLQESGYQLTFATRSHEPRTWFHFGRDRLYLKMRHDQAAGRRPPGPRDDISIGWDNPLLSGAPWDIGQFTVADLRRVEHLFLDDRFEVTITHMLPLLPNVKDIWIKGWGAEAIQECLSQASGSEALSEEAQQGRLGSRGREIWRCVPAEEMDQVGHMYWCRDAIAFDTEHSNPWSGAESIDIYNRFKNIEQKMTFYQDMACYVENHLKRNLRTPRDIPTIKFVHVCPEGLAKQFVKERHMFWRYFDEVQRGVARDMDSSPSKLGFPEHPPSLLGWYNRPEYEMWSQILRRVKNMDVIATMRQPWDIEVKIPLRLQAWYITDAEVPEPSLELL